jgi:hypothetical protein
MNVSRTFVSAAEHPVTISLPTYRQITVPSSQLHPESNAALHCVDADNHAVESEQQHLLFRLRQQARDNPSAL